MKNIFFIGWFFIFIAGTAQASSRCGETLGKIEIDLRVSAVYKSSFQNLNEKEVEEVFLEEKEKFFESLDLDSWQDVTEAYPSVLGIVSSVMSLPNREDVVIAGVVKDVRGGVVASYSGRLSTMLMLSYIDRPDDYFGVLLDNQGNEFKVNLSQSEHVYFLR